MNFSRRLIASEILAANRREQRFTKYGVGTPASGGVMDRMRQMGKPGPGGLTYTVPLSLIMSSTILSLHYIANIFEF